MPLLQVSSLTFSFGDRVILHDLSLLLDRGTRYALSGANGSGKSTLLKILAGQIESQGGSIYVEKGARIGYLPQSGIVHAGATLRAEAERAFDDLHDLVRELDDLGHKIEETSTRRMAASGPAQAALDSELETLLLRQYEVNEILDRADYYNRERRIEQIFKGLGFLPRDFDRPAAEFSGGWQMRIALGKILLANPAVLFLDEPTNHLDIEARAWLQEWLRGFDGAVLMVSHDRHFLDATVSGVAELYLSKLTLYKGNYTQYEKRREAELADVLKRYEMQQEEIARLEEFIRRFRANASKAPMVQSRVKTLEKIVRIEVPEGLKKIRFHFPPAARSGDVVLSVRGLHKTWPGVKLFNGVDFQIMRGQKIALVGTNGAGKSSLMKIIFGRDFAFDGHISWGANVVPAYFAQDSEAELDPELTVMETLEARAGTEMYPKLRGLLGAFLFRGDDIHKPVRVLSGGERNRLALAAMLLNQANFLILDEPTNHLDLASKDVLLDALKSFDGTILFVSHDRQFIETLADRVIEVERNPDDFEGFRRVRDYPGDYEYYLSQTSRPNQFGGSLAQPKPKKAGDESGSGAQSTASGTKTTAQAAGQMTPSPSRDKKSPEVRKLEKLEAQLLEKIEALETRRETVVQKLAAPENYTDGAKMKSLNVELSAVEGAIATITEEWEKVSAALAGPV